MSTCKSFEQRMAIACVDTGTIYRSVYQTQVDYLTSNKLPCVNHGDSVYWRHLWPENHNFNKYGFSSSA